MAVSVQEKDPRVLQEAPLSAKEVESLAFDLIQEFKTVSGIKEPCARDINVGESTYKVHYLFRYPFKEEMGTQQILIEKRCEQVTDRERFFLEARRFAEQEPQEPARIVYSKGRKKQLVNTELAVQRVEDFLSQIKTRF